MSMRRAGMAEACCSDDGSLALCANGPSEGPMRRGSDSDCSNGAGRGRARRGGAGACRRAGAAETAERASATGGGGGEPPELDAWDSGCGLG